MEPFSEGRAVIQKGDAYAFIDETGKIIVPFNKYRFPDRYCNGYAKVLNDKNEALLLEAQALSHAQGASETFHGALLAAHVDLQHAVLIEGLDETGGHRARQIRCAHRHRHRQREANDIVGRRPNHRLIEVA